jgi:nucleotide-binding universal stress UspA family protein
MYKRMLVPLDGSKIAEVVLSYAIELAGRLDLHLVFLHVCGSHEPETVPMCQAYIEHMAEMALLKSREVQTKSGVQSGTRMVETQGEVIAGHPAEEILHYSDQNDIDLILLASHGRSGIRQWMIGNVADKILRASKVPVWLVRAGIPEEIVYDEWPKRTMLVPLDGSHLSETVFPHVEALAKQRGAEMVNVVLLRVYEQPFITADYAGETDWEEHVKRITDRFREISEQYLVKVKERLSNVGLNVKSEVIMGRPADEIIEYAHMTPPNLIVMTTHGHSGLGSWAFGSVSNKVLYNVRSPVFLVRPH